MKFSIKVEGFDKVKDMFKSIGFELSPSQVRGLLDSGGKIVLKEAKSDVEFTGDIAEDFKKDLAVYRDDVRSNKNSEHVIIGPRFKQYNIHGQPQKVALIAQHLTQGFAQTDRRTKSGQSRGRVGNQVANPMLKAFNTTKNTVQEGINKGVIKKLEKIKAKHPEIIK